MAHYDPMKCPACGATMNFHAEKLDYGAALADPHATEGDWGGVLEEIHTCPSCGRSAARRPANESGLGKAE